MSVVLTVATFSVQAADPADRGYTVQRTRTVAGMNQYQLLSPGGDQLTASVRDEFTAAQLDTLDHIVDVVFGFEYIDPSTLSVAFSLDRVEATVGLRGFLFDTVDLRTLTPSGIKLVRANGADELVYDFSMIVDDLRLRMSGEYFSEIQLAEKMVRAARNPVAYLQSQDPEYIIERFDELDRVIGRLINLLDVEVAERTALSGEHDATVADLGRLRDEHDTLSDQHQDLAERHEDLSDRNADLTADHIALGGRHEQLRTDYESLLRSHRALTDDYNDLLAAHEALLGEHETLAASHDDLRSDHDALSADQRALRGDHDDLATSQDDFYAEYLTRVQTVDAALAADTRALAAAVARQDSARAAAVSQLERALADAVARQDSLRDDAVDELSETDNDLASRLSRSIAAQDAARAALRDFVVASDTALDDNLAAHAAAADLRFDQRVAFVDQRFSDRAALVDRRYSARASAVDERFDTTISMGLQRLEELDSEFAAAMDREIAARNQNVADLVAAREAAVATLNEARDAAVETLTTERLALGDMLRQADEDLETRLQEQHDDLRADHEDIAGQFARTRYGLMVLNNRGLFGGINLPTQVVVDRIVADKRAEPSLMIDTLYRRLRDEDVEVSKNEVFLVFALYFNEFE